MDRCRKQTSSYQRAEEWERGKLGVVNQEVQTLLCIKEMLQWDIKQHKDHSQCVIVTMINGLKPLKIGSYCVAWVSESRSFVSDSLQPHRLYSPRNSPGQNTGVGSLSLLQGTFPTQGSNPCLLHRRRILYRLSHQGSPTMLHTYIKCTSNNNIFLKDVWSGMSVSTLLEPVKNWK